MQDDETLDFLLGSEDVTFGNLVQWCELGGRCSRCKRAGWVDRWELKRKFGSLHYIHRTQHLLRCVGCGNKGDNRWIVRKIPR